MSTDPVPFNLVLLSNLSSISSGTKVRFLGCVEGYSAQTGRVRLSHPSSSTIASVDISHTDAKSKDLDVGAWLNVIGYVEIEPRLSGREREKGKQAEKERSREGYPQDENTESEVPVQAILLWNAGALDVQAYEKAVKVRMQVDEIVRSHLKE